MIVRYRDGSTEDVPAPTIEQARALISEGAANVTELLMAAGMSAKEAEDELRALPVNYDDFGIVDEDGEWIRKPNPPGLMPS